MALAAFREGALRRVIAAHVKAQIELSWKGSKMPEEWGEIELQAKLAEDALDGVIALL